MKFKDFIEKLLDGCALILDIVNKEGSNGISLEVSEESSKLVREILVNNFKNHIVDSFHIDDGVLRVFLELEE